MKSFIITYCFIFFTFSICYGQIENVFVKGIISNYANQPLTLYKCYGDTLLLSDTIHTGRKGEFTFSISAKNIQLSKHITKHRAGMYKISLKKNQFFHILFDEQPVDIRTVYQDNAFYNIAADSLEVLKSDDNKKFCEFMRIQMQLNTANYWLMQMMRLYPLPDPFHRQIEDEYFSRYNTMEQFVKKLLNEKQNKTKQLSNNLMTTNDNLKRMSAKIALAYYQPVNPDWKQPDPWRDSIFALHYFDYFNPADSFYIYTNILPEKLDIYIKLCTNKRDAYGQPINNENLYMQAAENFINKTKINQTNFEFCLQYLLKNFKKDRRETAFLYLYDLYLKPKEGDCQAENKQFDWAREIANKLRNISTGSVAPDFDVNDNLKLSQIKSNYTLLLFWASWCPHCTQLVPGIKKVTDEFNQNAAKKLLTITVSLDTDKEQWKKFIAESNLSSFLNFSELKGWYSEVVKKYNVYATPSMFLLDKDKKIISKPITIEALKEQLSLIK